MASTSLAFLSQANPLHLSHKYLYQNQTSTNPSQQQHYHYHHHVHLTHPLSLKKHHHHFSIKCTPDSAPQLPDNINTNMDNFPIEKMRKSEIIRDRKAKADLAKAEPPNFEIGWKRTKETQPEKPKGYVIADFLEKLEGLMGQEFGSTELLAKAGEIVAERAREEAEVLRDGGEVEERLVTELFRVLRLMEMDLAMVKAAVKEETLSERLEQAKARCRQAILVANSF
uniref:Chlororespiratory reduction 41 n=1 Tax=Hypseocharis bilobata TaxID=253189 RepID=A0A0F7J419_9ROSI|nr:chlororespiratory reduction 41 [Hypseocharis bilobata]